MQEPLATYLHDHLAGAAVAIELLEVMRKRKDPLGSFANHLLNEVEVDRTTLKELANKIGSGENVIKEAAGWLSERDHSAEIRSHHGQ